MLPTIKSSFLGKRDFTRVPMSPSGSKVSFSRYYASFFNKYIPILLSMSISMFFRRTSKNILLALSFIESSRLAIMLFFFLALFSLSARTVSLNQPANYFGLAMNYSILWLIFRSLSLAKASLRQDSTQFSLLDY
jgi:hypothetical protein